jgi:sugar/nucleoside kinase (ribokinase family)
LHGLGFENIVLHRGSQGALVSSPGGQFEVAAGAANQIADVTGAGDAAVAGLILGLLEGLPIGEAAQLGQKAAALKLASHLSVSPKLSRDSLLKP